MCRSVTAAAPGSRGHRVAINQEMSKRRRAIFGFCRVREPLEEALDRLRAALPRAERDEPR
jgi:hypothetical protein